MPPLIILAAAGVGLYAGFKLFSKFIEQVQTPSRKQAESSAKRGQTAKVGTKDLGELEWDEKSGAYVPKKHVGGV